MKTTDKNNSSQSISDPSQWVDLYGDYLFRFALAKINDPPVAEDLVQETFLAALKSRREFKGRASVKTWLTAIMRHKIIDRLRLKYRDQAFEDIESVAAATDALFDASGHWKLHPRDWRDNPSDNFEQQEFMTVLHQCLAGLPKRLSHIFVLREIEDKDFKDICKELGITSTNGWVMMHRARSFLRRCLETHWFEKAPVEDSP